LKTLHEILIETSALRLSGDVIPIASGTTSTSASTAEMSVDHKETYATIDIDRYFQLRVLKPLLVGCELK